MSILAIGALKHRVTLEQLTSTPDGGGGEVEAWTFVANVWAAIDANGTAESYTGDTLQGVSRLQIWIRHRTDVTTQMRFVYGTRLFEIRSITNVGEDNRFLQISVEERTQ